MSVPPINTNPTWGATGPSDDMDTDNTVIQAVGEAWTAYEAWMNNPTSTFNAETLIQTINNLNTIISANGPPGPSSPNTQTLYTFLNQTDYEGKSLASACTVPPSQTTIDWLTGANTSAQGMLSEFNNTVYSDWTHITTNDSSNPTVQNAVTDLNDYIIAYNKSPTAANALQVGLAINALKTALSSASDGYVTVFNAVLDSSIDAGGDTLSSLAGLLTSGESTNPPSTNLTNFMNALAGTSGSGTVLSDLTYYVSISGYEEGWLSTRPPIVSAD